MLTTTASNASTEDNGEVLNMLEGDVGGLDNRANLIAGFDPEFPHRTRGDNGANGPRRRVDDDFGDHFIRDDLAHRAREMVTNASMIHGRRSVVANPFRGRVKTRYPQEKITRGQKSRPYGRLSRIT